MYLQYYHLVYSVQYDGYNVPAFLTFDAQLTQSLGSEDAINPACTVIILRWHRGSEGNTAFHSTPHVCWNERCPFHGSLFLSVCLQLTRIQRLPAYCPYSMSVKWQRLYLKHKVTDTSLRLSARMAGKHHTCSLFSILCMRLTQASTFWPPQQTQEPSVRICFWLSVCPENIAMRIRD